MNHIFKTISKKIKGRVNTTIVVSENASSLTKITDNRSSLDENQTYSDFYTTLKQVLSVSLASILFVSSLQADIIADTNAPTNTQPIILNTQSGATQVNIQTPTSSGISVNNYSQFDTGTNGTILNNSRTNVNTVTAGWVEGNPFLATGSATAIVNQVNSSNPSNLTGNIEIAGSKADLIIANPSGISIDGATIINAGTSTLTTGTPIINGGDLSGFSVNDGTISVQGAGLNALGSDYTNILARSTAINAGIWANELSIITGVNTISHDSSNITAGTGVTTAPLFAIDSSALGGMYANKINLIGTEVGVGVNNAGVVGANDNISIDINGKLTNSGTVVSSNNMDIKSTNLVNNKTISSNSKTIINVNETLTNSGTINSNGKLSINTKDVDNHATGEISATSNIINVSDTLTNQGLIDGSQTVVKAQTLNNIGTGRVYGDWLALQADTINNIKESDKSAVIGAREELNIGATTINNIDGSTILSLGSLNIGGSLDENGFAIDKAKEINNLSATIESGGDMGLASDEINNKTLTQATKDIKTINSDIVTLNEKYSQLSNGSIKTSYVVSDADVRSITSNLLNQYIQDGKTKQITISLEDSLDGYVLLNGKKYSIANNPNIRYIRSSGSDKIYIVPNDIEIFISEATTALNDKYSKFDLEVHYTTPTAINQWAVSYEPDSGYRLDVSLYSEERQREYSDITTEEYFSLIPTNPSLISSGSKLDIKGNNVTNYLSTILSAGDMKFDITGTLDNKSEALYRYDTTSGKFLYCYKECHDMFHSPNYTWAPLAITQSNTQKIGEIDSSILAGGSIIGNFGSLQNGMEENSPLVQQNSAVSDEFSNTTVDTSLPNSSLFTTNPDNPNYFIQTDPRFTNYKNFISSDYMLSKLSLDPTTLHKRLGDGYYEQKLIREQVMTLTGKRFLEGFNSDEEQYMALLNSGVEYMKSFDISAGVALSSEQMKNLTKDVVLLVEKEITLSDGTKSIALVPQLYTTASKINTSGSLIAANSINVNVANTLSNGGKIYSDTTMNIQANALTNNQGTLSANNALNITTTNDIQNLSGAISGSSVALTSTDGSIINKTLTQEKSIDHTVGKETYTVVGKKATITATGNNDVPTVSNEQVINSANNKAMMPIKKEYTLNKIHDTTPSETSTSSTSGNVILNAKNDIVNSGADISATNSILLKAGNDIKIDTSVDGASYDFKLKNGYMKGDSTTNITSNITSGEHVIIQSGNDITLKGANINAKETVALEAGGSLDILSAVDSDYETSKFVDKGFLSKKTTINESLEQSVISSSIQGENIILSGDVGVTVEASKIKADESVDISSKEGDITLTTTHYLNISSHEVKKSSWGSLIKKEALDILQNDQVSQTLIDAKSVTLTSENGAVILNGTDIQAQTVEVMADTLALISDKENSTQTSFSDNSGILTRTIIDEGDIKEEAVASTINAQEIMLNGKSLLDEKLDKEKLFQTITSEYNLNNEQIIQVKAILNSKEWYDKTTTMSQLGQLIITAIATVCTAGAGIGVAAAGSMGISSAATSAAVAASIDAMVANAISQVAAGVITGDMKIDLKSMIKSAVTAGALSGATSIIDTQMGYNAIDPTTGERVVLSYGEKASQEILHGLAKSAITGEDIQTSLVGSVGNVAFEYVGHELYENNPDFPIPKTVTHSLIGGTLSELAGGDFSQGAISTAVSHTISSALVGDYAMDVVVGDKSMDQTLIELEAISKVIAGAVVLATHENVSDKELESALAMASSVALYNDAKEIQKIKDSITPEEKQIIRLLKEMTPEQKAKSDAWLKALEANQALGTYDELETVLGIKFAKPLGTLIGSVATKLGTSTTVLLERLGVVSPKIKYSNYEKITFQMKQRGWTEQDILDALKTKGIPTVGKNGPATRYINPNTGKSVVVDNKTKEIFHVGGEGYKYDY